MINYAIRQKIQLYLANSFIFISEDKIVNIMIIGSNEYAYNFIDVCLEMGQIPGIEVNVFVLCNSKENKNEYLKYRPGISKFVKINGVLNDVNSTMYGSIYFFSLNNCNEAEITYEKILKRYNCKLAFVSTDDAELDKLITDDIEKYNSNYGIDCNTIIYSEKEDKLYGSKEIKKLIDAKTLEQWAFNTHISWRDTLDYDINDMEKEFRSIYNYNASLSFAVSIVNKLYYLGIEYYNQTDAAKEFMEFKKNKKNKSKLEKLREYEHRRWVLEKVTAGWLYPETETRLSIYNEYIMDGRVKDSEGMLHKIHPCIVKSTSTLELQKNDYNKENRKKWLEPVPANFDELDRVSLELHQCHVRYANKFKEKYNIDNIEDEDNISYIKAYVEKYYELLYEIYNKYILSIKRIIEGDKNNVIQYNRYLGDLLNVININAKKEDYDSIKKYALEFKKKFFPVIESIMYRDYKKYDDVLINKIPFIITYKPNPKMIMSFDDARYYSGRNNQLFNNVASLFVLNPRKITYIYSYDDQSRWSYLCSKIDFVMNMIKTRKLNTDVEFIIFLPPARQYIKKKLEPALSNILGCKYNIVCIDCIEEYILARLDEFDLYDGSTVMFRSNIDNAKWYNNVISSNIPYFEYNINKKMFYHVNRCEYLQYIEENTYLRVHEMFALRRAIGKKQNLPNCVKIYMKLWELYVKNNKLLKYSVKNWFQMCVFLNLLFRNIDGVNINNVDITRDLKGPDGKVYYGKNYSYVLNLLKQIANLKIIKCNYHEDSNLVDIDLGTEQIKSILTKEGEILEVFIYFSALKTGYFDEVVAGYEFLWQDMETSNEIDCILVKGFKSVIIECKSTRELKQGYYQKLDSLGERFGINALKIIVANTYDELLDDINEMQISRGKQMNIITINQLEDIENIGEVLKNIVEKEGDINV